MRQDKKVFALILLVGAIIIVGITYAWSDYHQHKTNIVLGKGQYKDVTLIEIFDPEAAKDFSIEAPLEKLVSVKNVGEDHAYVRVKLKEFLQTFNENYTYSKLRYVTDQNGLFVKASNLLPKKDIVMELNRKLQELGFEPSLTITAFADVNDGSRPEKRLIHEIRDLKGESSYYVSTIDGDPHGQYGKHIALDSTVDTSKAVILEGGGKEGIPPHTDQSKYHQKGGEDVHQDCDLYQEINFSKNDNISRKYIKLLQNVIKPSVIAHDEYLKNREQYVKGVWIYQSQDNYLYYSKTLMPSESTSYVLEGLQMVSTPNNSFEYLNHIDLEAVTFDELSDEWKTIILN